MRSVISVSINEYDDERNVTTEWQNGSGRTTTEWWKPGITVRMLHIVNVRTRDDAERQIDLEKSGSKGTECVTDTQQKTSSHCHRSTTELIM